MSVYPCYLKLYVCAAKKADVLALGSQCTVIYNAIVCLDPWLFSFGTIDHIVGLRRRLVALTLVQAWLMEEQGEVVSLLDSRHRPHPPLVLVSARGAYRGWGQWR